MNIIIKNWLASHLYKYNILRSELIPPVETFRQIYVWV